MKDIASTRVWNFDLPPFPREGLFHLNMSEHCQVSRLLKFEAGRLACLNQLDVFHDGGELLAFQRRLRAALWKKFGCRYDGTLPLKVKEFGTIRQDGFSIIKLIYQSRPGIFVTGLLYVPEGRGPFPAVLQMHGHNDLAKFGINPQATSLDLVKSGFVCLSVDSFGSYERSEHCYQVEYHGGVLGAGVLNIGETLMGMQVVDNMRGIDLLRSLPYVRKNRIGATGASGGGNQTMWVSAMDTRIAAAMPVVSVGSFESYVYGMNCLCELLPDGLTMTEEGGILALIAPRHLRIANALYDCNHDFSLSEMMKTYHAVEKIYWNLGKPEKISCSVADRVHGMTDRQRESVLGFFTYALKGEGNGANLPEPESELLPEEKLHLFSEPSERAENQVRSIGEHCRMVGEELRRQYLARPSFSSSELRRQLKEILRLKALPAARLHRYAEVNGVGRAALEVGAHVIPFLIVPGKAERKFRIVLHPQGKATLDAEMLKEASADGATLILPDLFGTGETAQPNHVIGLHHQFFRQLLWIGHSLIGEWTFDLLALLRMLRKEFKAEQIIVRGLLEMGFTAICGNVFSRDADAVEAVRTPGSLLFDRQVVQYTMKDAFAKFLPGAVYSLALSMPGFLKWGDVSLAVALGSAPVKFQDPSTSEGKIYSDEERKIMEKEIADVKKKIR